MAKRAALTRPKLGMLAALLLSTTGGIACAPAAGSRAASSPRRDTITWVTPRCAGVQSCVLGRVTASESAQPLVHAAVFLEQQGDASSAGDGPDPTVRLITLTDEDGVFTVQDPPPGHYRVAVYKEARHAEVRGIQLGSRGTTLVPVSLAP